VNTMIAAAGALVLAGIARGEDLPTSRLADSPAYDSGAEMRTTAAWRAGLFCQSNLDPL
jgi:hypothetical protein